MARILFQKSGTAGGDDLPFPILLCLLSEVLKSQSLDRSKAYWKAVKTWSEPFIPLHTGCDSGVMDPPMTAFDYLKAELSGA